MAWHGLGWSPVWFSQYDPEHNYSKGQDFSSEVLKHHYPNVPNLGDMTKLKDNEFYNDSKFDLLVGGTPCFTGETLITTRRGLVKIKDILIGDEVLTHLGRWRKVTDWGTKKSSIREFKVSGHSTIFTTDDHPILSGALEWVEAKKLFPGTKVCSSDDIASMSSQKYVLKEVLENKKSERVDNVYNITVEEDNTYVANGIVVHNCQSFSVAGLREGLSDPRGNLALEFVRLLNDKRPTWFIWENVPGVLSSNGGRDFASILGAFTKIGFNCAWRVLDSQFFGVPQRRRRVFVVGHIRDWRSAAAVLFEPEGLSGNTKPSSEKGKENSRDLGKGVKGFDMRGFGDYGEGKTSSTLKKRDGKDATDSVVSAYAYSKSHRDNGQVDVRFTDDGKSNTLTCGDGCGNQSTLNIVVTPIIFEPRSPDGVPRLSKDGLCPTLNTMQGGQRQPCVAFSENIRAEVRLVGGDGQTVGCLTSKGGGKPGQGYPAIAYRTNSKGQIDSQGDKSACLTTFTDPTTQFIPSTSYGVRRLTPEECEQLQGFPRGFTNIPWRGKNNSPDSLRYSSIGNSMAVPVMKWLGERIAKVDEIEKSGVQFPKEWARIVL